MMCVLLLPKSIGIYKQGIHYPRYELLFYGWYSEEWWKVEDDTLGCTAEERQSVIGPALSPLQDEFISNCSQTTDSGIVSRMRTCTIIPNHSTRMPESCSHLLTSASYP